VDRNEILRALTALGERLHNRGVTADLYVVGGAAITLAYADRRSTRDIDAVFEPKMLVYEVAGEVERALGLEPGWLNDAAKGFLVPDPEAGASFDLPGLRVTVASPRMLLALKVLAHRVGEDEEDVRLLAGIVGAQTAAHVLRVAEETFGDRLDAATRFFVEELFSERGP